MCGRVSEVGLIPLVDTAIMVDWTVLEVVDVRANGGSRDAGDKIHSVCQSDLASSSEGR